MLGVKTNSSFTGLLWVGETTTWVRDPIMTLSVYQALLCAKHHTRCLMYFILINLMPDLLATVHKLDACRMNIEMPSSLWLRCSGMAPQKRRHLNRAVSLGRRSGGFKLGLEKRQENSESDPSHPVVVSVRSAGGVCRVEWRGRKERENGLPRFPFPSLCLSLLKSDLPQMPRAFFAHKM